MAEAGRARIALIDDDTALVSLLHDLLAELEGHEVLICTDGDRAYEFLKQHRPDLALVDIRMGGEAVGWTLLERLTRDPEIRAIPLIVCSAAIGALRDDEPLLRRDGVDVLPKPFDLDVLLAKVETALAKRRD